MSPYCFTLASVVVVCYFVFASLIQLEWPVHVCLGYNKGSKYFQLMCVLLEIAMQHQ